MEIIPTIGSPLNVCKGMVLQRLREALAYKFDGHSGIEIMTELEPGIVSELSVMMSSVIPEDVHGYLDIQSDVRKFIANDDLDASLYRYWKFCQMINN